MSRIFFDQELETAATFWRVFRKDGVALGFTSHDRDLAFDGILHRSAPGMVPTAIRRTSDLSEENAGVEGALSHDAISEDDLSAGLYDEAAIEVGIVDWENLEHHSLYSGKLGRIEDNKNTFSGELRSAKAVLEQDLVPRTSPTCRAAFCGHGCGLSAARFTNRVIVEEANLDFNQIRVSGISVENYLDGEVRFLEGPQTGMTFAIVGISDDWLMLDRPLADALISGMPAELRQGCDHTLGTCTSRFNNALNFRGEPFLPGNDLLARYGQGLG